MAKLDSSTIFGPLFVNGEVKMKRDLEVFGDFYVSGIKLTATIAELNKITKIVEYVVIIGNNRKFISVLIVPSKNYDKTKNKTKIIESAIKIVNKKYSSKIKKYLIKICKT